MLRKVTIDRDDILLIQSKIPDWDLNWQTDYRGSIGELNTFIGTDYSDTQFVLKLKSMNDADLSNFCNMVVVYPNEKSVFISHLQVLFQKHTT